MAVYPTVYFREYPHYLDVADIGDKDSLSVIPRVYYTLHRHCYEDLKYNFFELAALRSDF
jgi:hypothetical protein